MEEMWKDIKGYEGYYQVSSLGRVKSLDRKIVDSLGNTKLIKGKIRSSGAGCDYERVALYLNGCKAKGKSVHRLVAEAFIPNPENKPYVNHINGIKNDNRVENLEWCTASENTQHAFDTGLQGKGEVHSQAKLTNNQVVEICNLLDSKSILHVDIAKLYRVDPSTIQKIHLGTHWNWLTGRKGKVKASDKLGSNHYASRPLVNCRGEVFNTVTEAVNKYGTSTSNICAAAKGKRKTACKYEDGTKIKWRYVSTTDAKQPNHYDPQIHVNGNK